MAFLQQKMLLFMISVALILAPSLPSSLCCETSTENCLQDLCTDNFRPEQCREIIKSNYDGFNASVSGAAYTAINLTRGKAVEIFDLLNRLHNDSDNDELTEKYQLCINNYNDTICDIDQAKCSLDFDTSAEFTNNISAQIHAVMDDFEECRHNFNETSFDPAHIMDRNKEFFVYAQIAKVASERLENITIPL